MTTSSSCWRNERRMKARRAVEASILFVAVPLSLFSVRGRIGRLLIPMLLIMMAVCLVLLLTDRTFPRRSFLRRGGARRDWVLMLQRLLLGGAVLAAATAVWRPNLFLQFPLQRPRVWGIVMLAYPLLSVVPQEIMFRTFFFHRYRMLFPRPRAMAAASALAFGLGHLFFGTWIAVLLSTGGGWLFADTYRRTGSTWAASVEHALWGDLVFTIGLGWFFYTGSIQ
jgi:uncharacterized protein